MVRDTTGLADRDALVERLIAVAREAGEEILRHYRAGVEFERKADASPVTEADRAAERIIVAALNRLTPAVPIVAEELAAAGEIPEVGVRFWLVDPLDGTREFLNHNDEFTVNIGLIEDRRPTLGVVHVPAKDETFWATEPGKVWTQREGGVPEPIAVRRPAEEGVVVTASRRHGDSERLAAFLDGTPVRDRISAGSSLKFCLLAAGRADLYPRFGPTSEWDTAAGHAVLAAAGGSVRTLDGADLLYGKPTFRNPEFIARGADAEEKSK